MCKICSNTLISFMLTGLLLGCGASDRTIEITETRQTSAPRPPADPHASTGQRLMNQPAAQMAADTAAESQNLFSWTTPDGWIELPTTDLRLVNLQPAGNPDAECTVTILSGGGGGVAENINRWRAQMGQPALTEDELAALPKSTLFGREATMVTIDGAYAGMGGTPEKPDFRMIGLVLPAPNAGVFIKMVGPKALVEAETDKFMAFCNSLQLAGMSAPAATESAQAPAPMAAQQQPETFETAQTDITWDAPAGWEQAPDRPMRLVTFNAGAAECYIIVLPGDGGGVYANLDRWARQMGQQQPMSPESVKALPTIPVFGADCPLLEVTGNYTDMSGQVTENAMLIGTIGEKNGNSVYVRITGPAAAVAEQKENFIAFCKSLK